ncbi:MAG: helix-turn-helix transcriptional regulator [Roseivirga sp.]|nr:helix-turn-helix transcriptional regulator [Roseivirga sp.]
MNRIFKAIADPTRREIFNVLILAATAMTISQISEQFEISRQGVTKHIKMLKEAGLVEMKQAGRENYCLADPTPLKEVHSWLTAYEKFWDDKLTNLSDFLDNSTKES